MTHSPLTHSQQDGIYQAMDIRSKIGKRIKELRLTAGFTQESFSLSCELDRTYIASVENGKRNISIKNIEKISKALGLSIKAFFDSEIFNEN